MTHASVTAQEILREHEVVRSLLNELRTLLAEGQRRSTDPQWNGRLCEKLWQFRRHLLRHFVLEETGGFMDDVVMRWPPAEEKVKKLRQDHVRILWSVDDLINASDLQASGGRAAFADFRRRCESLFTLIHQHETEENELIQQVYYVEVSALD